MNFSEVKQSKKNSVVPLVATSNTIEGGDNISENFDHQEEDAEELLKYELAPYPIWLY